MPLRDDLLDPIPGDNPSGANLRYDPITDKIKEARREDLDVPQGEWKTAIKTADYPQVIKMASDLLAKKGKDLQIAVWLVDAHIRREGFAVLGPAFQFLRELLERFWDTLYPEIEDGDLEVRAAPLDWLGSKLEEALQRLPLTSNKLSWIDYTESRLIGYEADADTPEKQALRSARIEDGKITAELFDEGVDGTSLSFYQGALEALNGGLAALEVLSYYCDVQFGDVAPSFTKSKTALENMEQAVRMLINRKGGSAEAAPAAEETPEEDFLVVPAAAPEKPAPKKAAKPKRKPEPEPESEAEPEPEPQAAQASSGFMAEWLAPDIFSGPKTAREPEDLDTAVAQIVAICRFLRKEDANNPAPYLILRGLRWGELRNNAPPIDSGMLEAPSSETRVSLKGFADESDWDQLLETAESAMGLPCGRGWLDLQRYAVTALEGKSADAAARAVKSNLRALLKDLPELLDATLPDDTPVANQETKDWIESSVMQDSSSDAAADDSLSSFGDDSLSSSDDSLSSSDDLSSGSEEEASPEETPSEPEPVEVSLDDAPPALDEEPPSTAENPDIFDMALEAARDGRITEGLEMISKSLATERCGRGRFRRRTQLAHLLMAGGHIKIAQPILDELAAEIEERRLEQWEPGEAMAYPLELLFRSLGSDGDHAERKNQLYTKICKMDPLRALNCPV